MRGDRAPFELPGDERGVLCIHGFTGTPFEMSYLGAQLNARGLTVSCPVLPGHDGDTAAINDSLWQDWYGAVRTAFDALRQRCRSVAVAGLSLGGLLALHLARERGPEQLAALAAISTPLWLPFHTRQAVRLMRRTGLHRWVPLVPKPGGTSDLRDPAMRGRNPSFIGFPTRAVLSFDDFRQRVRGELAEVFVPTLVIHARHDHTAPFACAPYLAGALGTTDVAFVPLAGSYHVTPLDLERDVVARRVAAFFETRLQRGADSEGEA
jgi:carboxylesterase